MTTKRSTSTSRDLGAELAFLTRALKAPSLADAIPRLAERARADSWTHEEFLAACLQREVAARESHGGEGRIRAARFPARKALEEFDFDYQRSLKRDQIAHLGTLDFIAAKQNVVFLGPPGTGKTHLSIGLGIRACQAGYRVAFATAAQWVDRLAAAHHSGRLQDELVKLGRVPLLIIDEVGYIPFESEAANLFFQLISARYERASLIVAANIEMIVAGDIDDELRQQVLRRYPKIRVLGFVEDLGPLTAEARAGLIADTVGGGFKLRLLPHVFHRLPIVGLTTAVDGLPTPAGMGYLAAASLDELATLVCDVIDNLERLNAVQNRAYDDCARAFSWQQCANSLTAAIGNSTGTSLA